jgi:methyl-accepting chemotaxis protein
MEELPSTILNKLVQIESLLNSSHVLNGGFEKLVQDVQHTNDQLGEVKESLEAMNSTINDPESGVRSRVRDLESESQRRWLFVQEAQHKMDEFDDLLSWKRDVEDKVKTIDLHNLELDRLKIWQSNLSKLQWLFGSTLAILIIQALFGVLLP